MKKAISVLLSLFMAVSALGGCSGSSISSDELNIAIGGSPLTVDPQLAMDTSSSDVITFFISTLYEYNDKNEITPWLAESCDISEDGLTYTFHIKEGLKWSDGRPLEAEDFVYGMRRLADPDLKSGASYLITDCCRVKNAENVFLGKTPLNELGVSSPDSRTIIIELE